MIAVHQKFSPTQFGKLRFKFSKIHISSKVHLHMITSIVTQVIYNFTCLHFFYHCKIHFLRFIRAKLITELKILDVKSDIVLMNKSQ